jgi:hypothetical protein
VQTVPPPHTALNPQSSRMPPCLGLGCVKTPCRSWHNVPSQTSQALLYPRKVMGTMFLPNASALTGSWNRCRMVPRNIMVMTKSGAQSRTWIRMLVVKPTARKMMAHTTQIAHTPPYDGLTFSCRGGGEGAG